jgi:hypothetical protein
MQPGGYRFKTSIQEKKCSAEKLVRMNHRIEYECPSDIRDGEA